MTASFPKQQDQKSHTDVIRDSIGRMGSRAKLELALAKKKKKLGESKQILVCLCPLPQTSSSTMRTSPGSPPKDQMPRGEEPSHCS